MKELFYFIRDKERKPVITVCILVQDRVAKSRGVAICSDRDTPCTKLTAHQSNGPGIARRRAWKASDHSSDLYAIGREEAFIILDKVCFDSKKIWVDIVFPGM